MKEKYSPLKHHKRDKSKLKPPFSQFNMDMIDWERDLLPEHLWIELLANEYPDIAWWDIYNDFIDKLEAEIGDERICLLGFLTDFGIVPDESRRKFLANHKDFIYQFFYKPMGNILTLYPENPANWLILEEWKNEEKLDFVTELEKLSRSVRRLMEAKDLYAGHIRAIPLNRLFAHNRITISSNISVVDIIPRYPEKCTEEEKYRVQSFARMTMNMEYMQNDCYQSKIWPKYFWRQNYNLVPCVPSEIAFPKANRVSKDEMSTISNAINENCTTVIKYLDKIAIQFKYDLYEPLKDEILLGLFSRLTRLYVLYSSGPNLWARDLSGILHRCVVDTAITFAYLTQNGTQKDFQNFKEYGEGKEKLLMLHLQDTYKDKKTLENEDVKDIAKSIGGGINPELIEIELKGWTKRTSRKLAIDAGFEDYYKLVYDPASSDVHGSWTSLKKTNLVYCEQALHRYHKMPSFVEPPLFLNQVNFVQEIYLRCLDIGQKHLSFPKLDQPLTEIKQKRSTKVTS